MTDQLERLLELVEQESEDESPEWEQENLLPTFWQGWGGGREQQDRAGGQAPGKDRLTGEKNGFFKFKKRSCKKIFYTYERYAVRGGYDR